MKRCPYCAEKIQDAAIVCRYCGRELPPPPAPVHEAGTKVSQEGFAPRGGRQKFWSMLGMLALCVAGPALLCYYYGQLTGEYSNLQRYLPRAGAGWIGNYATWQPYSFDQYYAEAQGLLLKAVAPFFVILVIFAVRATFLNRSGTDTRSLFRARLGNLIPRNIGARIVFAVAATGLVAGLIGLISLQVRQMAIRSFVLDAQSQLGAAPQSEDALPPFETRITEPLYAVYKETMRPLSGAFRFNPGSVAVQCFDWNLRNLVVDATVHMAGSSGDSVWDAGYMFRKPPGWDDEFRLYVDSTGKWVFENVTPGNPSPHFEMIDSGNIGHPLHNNIPVRLKLITQDQQGYFYVDDALEAVLYLQSRYTGMVCLGSGFRTTSEIPDLPLVYQDFSIWRRIDE